MRDIALLLALITVVFFILKRPWIGIIAWVVVSVLNPHRLTYGFAYSLPAAQIIALATVFGMLFAQDKQKWKFPVSAVTVILIVFVVWMNLTTLFSLYPAEAFEKWLKVTKIMIVLFLGLYLLHSRAHLNAMVWAIAGSIAFYGIKGGVFALLTGGSFRIYGPADSEIADNNAISFANVMIIPLLYYLSTVYQNKWIKNGLRISIVLCSLAVLASQSRGAFLALAAGAMFLIIKSQKRVGLGIAVLALAPLLIAFMPESWMTRMETIETYDQDASAMGRINTWRMCFNLAKDHPIFGGGFGIWNADAFARWAPDPLDIHAAHSIFFAALGEHGFVGLFLFLTLLAVTWRTGTTVDKMTRGLPELKWAATLGRMLQVSLIGYVVGGAFLSVLYFDVFYYIIAILVLLRVVVEEEVKAKPPTGSSAITHGAHLLPSHQSVSPSARASDRPYQPRTT